MELALPHGIPTFYNPATGNGTRPDNVFHSMGLADAITVCDIRADLQCVGADHLPIETELDLALTRTEEQQRRNFHDVSWDKFKIALEENLGKIPAPQVTESAEALNEAVQQLTEAIQATIATNVPLIKPSRHSRRWWSEELSALKKTHSKLRSQAHKLRNDQTHPIHAALKEHSHKYSTEIEKQKREHWEEFLENVTQKTLYTAANYATKGPSD
ncbi:hypothetical protein MPER_15299 [Moniliophthora perniciosa FA553]|nr:hypothetical protein MPER_15299 [Moniliophthora perniciosa FA553]